MSHYSPVKVSRQDIPASNDIDIETRFDLPPFRFQGRKMPYPSMSDPKLDDDVGSQYASDATTSDSSPRSQFSVLSVHSSATSITSDIMGKTELAPRSSTSQYLGVPTSPIFTPTSRRLDKGKGKIVEMDEWRLAGAANPFPTQNQRLEPLTTVELAQQIARVRNSANRRPTTSSTPLDQPSSSFVAEHQFSTATESPWRLMLSTDVLREADNLRSVRSAGRLRDGTVSLKRASAIRVHSREGSAASSSRHEMDLVPYHIHQHSAPESSTSPSASATFDRLSIPPSPLDEDTADMYRRMSAIVNALEDGGEPGTSSRFQPSLDAEAWKQLRERRRGRNMALKPERSLPPVPVPQEPEQPVQFMVAQSEREGQPSHPPLFGSVKPRAREATRHRLLRSPISLSHLRQKFARSSTHSRSPQDDPFDSAIDMTPFLFGILNSDENVDLASPTDSDEPSDHPFPSSPPLPSASATNDPSPQLSAETLPNAPVAIPSPVEVEVVYTEECGICSSELELHEQAVIPKCGHVFCLDCMRHYVVGRLEDGHLTMPCPSCMAGRVDVGHAANRARGPTSNGELSREFVEMLELSLAEMEMLERLEMAEFAVLHRCPK